MREVTIPLAVDRSDLRSTMDLLADRVRINPAHIAFGRRVDGELTDVTTGEFDAEVRALAKGLVAAGLQPGDKVAIMSATRYEWAVADFAIWAAGAVVVPVYETSSASQTAHILETSGAKLAFAGDETHRAVLNSAAPELPVWSFETAAGNDLAALVTLGAATPDQEVDRRTAIAGPDDLASIVFTSGTTGGLKAVQITHGNLVRLVVQVAVAYEEVVNDRATTIILLPLAHILAQGLQLVSIHAGMKVVHASDPKAAVATMAEVRPTFMVVVPRILEKIRAAARGKAADKGLGKVFEAAERTAIEWGEFRERAQDIPDLKPSRGLALRHAFYDRLFYSKLRALMGGRIDYLLSGAAALERNLANFYRGIGVPVVEGYGLTETTAPVTGNRVGRMKAGSVGIPIPGSTVRIADDGEVLVRGVGVSPGYLDAAQNSEAFVDGFFRTGDLGSLDDEGFLYLQGRRKNILVTSGGKNVAPEPWEEAVRSDPLVSEVVMVGDGKPYVSALVVLDIDAAIPWASRSRSKELVEYLTHAAQNAGPAGIRVTSEAIVRHVEQVIARANAAVSRAEQVRQFAVLVANLTENDKVVTPTLKLRRGEFLNAAAAHVNDLYVGKVAPS